MIDAFRLDASSARTLLMPSFICKSNEGTLNNEKVNGTNHTANTATKLPL